MKPQPGSILCIYGASSLFVALDDLFSTSGVKTSSIMYKYPNVWILVQNNTLVKVKLLIQLLYSWK